MKRKKVVSLTILLLFTLIFGSVVSAVSTRLKVSHCTECDKECDHFTRGRSDWNECYSACLSLETANGGTNVVLGIWVDYDVGTDQCVSFEDITTGDPVGGNSGSPSDIYRPPILDRACYTDVDIEEECHWMPPLMDPLGDPVEYCFDNYYVIDPGYYSEQDGCVRSGVYRKRYTNYRNYRLSILVLV